MGCVECRLFALNVHASSYDCCDAWVVAEVKRIYSYHKTYGNLIEDYMSIQKKKKKKLIKACSAMCQVKQPGMETEKHKTHNCRKNIFIFISAGPSVTGGPYCATF